MKGICLLALLSFTMNCFAQNSTSFDKIIIRYARGCDTFGAPGIASIGEIFELAPKNRAGYKFTCYKKTKDSISPDGKRYLKDTSNMSLKKGSISKAKIDALFAALSTTKDNFTLHVIKPFLRIPSDDRILTDTNHVNKRDVFQDEDKENLKAEFDRIKKIDKIEAFIDTIKPNTKFELVVVDAWDFAQIIFIKNKDTIFFDMNRFKAPLGQPIRKSKKSQKKNIGLYVNLEANILLAEILPASSMTRKQFEIDAFTNDYIEWYIDNVL
jgi:hypothetical protein